MADLRSLVLESGRQKRVQDTDALIVGSGIKTGTGDLTITPAGSNVSIAAGKSIVAAVGAGTLDFSNATGIFKTSAGVVTLGPGAISVSGSATLATGTTLAAAGTAIVDLSGGSGIFKTTTGAVTIGPGAISVAGSVTLATGTTMTGAGTASVDLSGGSGAFKTTTGAVTVGPGAVAVSGAATFSAAGTALAVTKNASVGGNLSVTGNLIISGSTTTTSSETVLIADNHLHLNYGYNTVSAQSGGLIVNYLPTATADTVAGAYVAGVAATSNPTVTTTASATFAVGQIIQITGTANPGLYEVLSHVGTTLTIRGIGLTATVEDFTQNQFTAVASDGAAIRRVNVSILRAGTDGAWEVGSGASTGITFTDLAAGSSTLQSAYVAGNTLTTSAGEGTVNIAGTEDFIVSDSVDLAFTSTGGFSWTAATGAFNLQTTGAATLRGGASGTFGDDVATLDFNGAGAVGETGMTSFSITPSGAITLTAGAASTWSTSAGALTLTSAAAATWSTAAGALTINGTGGINLQGGATTAAIVNSTGTAITVQAGATLATTSTGNIDLPQNASARFKIEGVATTATVTAANLTTLTNASNADALHTHAGVATAFINGTAGETLVAGNIVVWDDSAGNPRIFKADANGAGELVNAVGIAGAGISSGSSGNITVAGEVAVPDAVWDSVPAVGDVGKVVYMSATAGNVTLTAPSTTGDTVQKVGVVTFGGTGAVKVAVQVGDGVLL